MRTLSALLCAAGLVVAALPAFANEPADAAPKAGEIRITVKLNERAVSFPGAAEPLARRTMAFEGQDHAPTDAMRAATAEIAQALAGADPTKAFVVTAYAADPLVAYRRARAVRGELIERHQVAAARLVAAGRAAVGHDGAATIVDVYAIDPTRCTGCGPTPFRAIAFDSGTMRLVTMLPERLAAAEAPARPAAPAAEPPTARPQPQRRIASAPQERAAPATAGCPRPRIIIDDYYPGGPMIPCSPRQNGGSRW